MTKITFNGITKPWLHALEGRQKSPFPPVNNNLLRVSGMPGAYVESTDTDILYITQPIGYVVKDDEDALAKKDELAEWFITKETVPLEFSDEPGRTYYAKVEGGISDFRKFSNQRKGTVTFVCPDPYGYSKEKQATFPSDTVTLTNQGTAEADPIFELEVLEPVTFAMIQNHLDQYVMIGQPVDEDGNEEIVDTKTSVLYENGSTIDDWSTANLDMVDSNFIDISGAMGADGSGVRPTNFGSGDKMHGPAVFKEISNAIQDFEIEASLDINSEREIENWRMEIYFQDENMNMLGKLGVKDNNRNYLRRHGLGRVGPYEDSTTRYAISSSNYLYDDSRDLTLMYLRVRREGKRYTFYIAQWFNLKHTRALTATYNDVNNNFQGRLKYITLFIGKYQDRPTPSRVRMNSVEVFELKTTTEDQTPYIVYPGDIITFDHKNEETLLNGEDATDLKQFGASYFSLAKGENQLIVHPGESFNTGVRFRERYK
ncbi:hypothetical protein GI584_14225 [Gracilibacillus salitolerans]|uniref:Phage tail protein n=1 Tax=Gracilibacillus salitolerans TaxID=2663022 RepID=A0A5Q2TJM3_9BACI|nr:distal tail protein Dit [Gracilibacillus salitolerans]QGH35129.1 hypothetical protein GI584_14225 [Gracilibacillus salitolerans]